MGIWLVSHPALQSYKQAEDSGMVQHTHRASSALPHNAAEALGTEEVIVGSIGSRKGRLWNCHVILLGCVPWWVTSTCALSVGRWSHANTIPTLAAP